MRRISADLAQSCERRGRDVLCEHRNELKNYPPFPQIFHRPKIRAADTRVGVSQHFFLESTGIQIAQVKL